jgi:hypothetical protein
MDKDTIEKNINFIANTSIGPSTIRNLIEPNTINKIRTSLKRINLKKFFFALKSDVEYTKFLDKKTKLLVQSSNFKDNSWGSARKCLNIFFRGICYNAFIPRFYDYKLGTKSYDALIDKLEIPLDSHVAKGLLKDAKKYKISTEGIPSWKGVKHLDENQSKLYQALAIQVAKKHKTLPVHLDLFYYRNENINNK